MQEGYFAFAYVMAAHTSALLPCWELAKGNRVDPAQSLESSCAEQLRSSLRVQRFG